MGYHGYIVERLICSIWFMWQGHIYVKDKGANLNTFTIVMTNIVSYTSFVLTMPYFATCYGHAMSKCCQYVTNDLKLCWNEKCFNQRTIISSSKDHYMDKKSGQKTCRDAYFCPWKLKTYVKILFASKVILFKETLEFKNVINLCYLQQLYLAKQNS
jgi:hypothetical protein